MSQVDVLIVGAGPAGASAAYHLARQGVRVLLLDKAVFPRDKTCGDGITAHALAQLERMGLGDWVQQGGFPAPSGVRVGAPDGTLATLRPTPAAGPAPVFGRIIPRHILDAALLQAALAAGAQFAPGVLAQTCTCAGGLARVRARADGRPVDFEAQLVIAADGTGGCFSRNLGLQTGPPPFAAVRAYVAAEDHGADFLDIFFDRDLLPCYAWVFPVGGGLCNVGLGAPHGQLQRINLPQRLHTLLERDAHLRERLARPRFVCPPRGAGLYTGFRASRAYAERLLAVGDAAGLVGPLTGGGISSALRSGELAAECAVAALAGGDCSARGLSAYGARLSSEFGRRWTGLLLMQRLLTQPRVVDALVRHLQRDPSLRLLGEQALADPVRLGQHVTPRLFLRLLLGG